MTANYLQITRRSISRIMMHSRLKNRDLDELNEWFMWFYPDKTNIMLYPSVVYNK